MNATIRAVVAVDVSLALKWVLLEQGSDRARQVLAAWTAAGIQPIVPSWFACELANVLYRIALRGALTLADAQADHANVMGLVWVAGDDPEDARRAMEIALQAGQPASYDAQYVALAERWGCELWTADERFVRALGGVLPFVRALSGT